MPIRAIVLGAVLWFGFGVRVSAVVAGSGGRAARFTGAASAFVASSPTPGGAAARARRVGRDAQRVHELGLAGRAGGDGCAGVGGRGTHLVGGGGGGDRAARAHTAAADLESRARRVSHREHGLAPPVNKF